MSFLSKLTGIHIKVPGLAQLGGVIDRNLPAISPLYNVAANVATGTPGKIAGNLATNAKLGLATAGAMGGLGGVSGLLSHIPGVSSLEGALGSIPGVGAIEGALKGAGGALSHIPGLQSIEQALGGQNGQSGLLGDLGSFLTGNGGKNALGVAQGVNAALLQKQASDYAKQAMGDVQSSYNERQPLRSAGIAGMLNPSVGANAAVAGLPQTGNPYARRPIPAVQAAPGGV